MLVGDPMRRTSKYRSQSCFRCYSGPNFGGDDRAPCTDTKIDYEGFPTVPCLGGIRSNIVYPTCWDGKNLDSPNHQDHVAYPVNGPAAFLNTGDCPASHPIKIPQLMLEVRLCCAYCTPILFDRWLICGRLFGIRHPSTTRPTGRKMARSLSSSALGTIQDTGNTGWAPSSPLI